MRPLVGVMEPTQDRARDNATGAATDRRGGGLQRQRSVRPLLVVVADELVQDGTQVGLVDDDQMVETLAPQGPHDPFGDRVRPRRSDRRQHSVDAEAPGPLHEVAPVDRVAVPQQVAGHPPPRRRLDELSPDPGSRRAGSDVEVHELAPGVADEHEHVQGSVRQRLDSQEVGCPQRRPVVLQERAPRLRRRASGSAPPVLQDRVLADRDPQFQELAADPLRAPCRVVARHRRDQLPDLGAQTRTTEPGTRLPPPEQAPPSPVPADDRLGLHEDEVPAPLPPDEADRQPEESVARAKARTLPGGARQDRELLAQEEVLGQQVAAAAEAGAEEGGEKVQILKHDPA
jgi:hypothetical protein